MTKRTRNVQKPISVTEAKVEDAWLKIAPDWQLDCEAYSYIAFRINDFKNLGLVPAMRVARYRDVYEHAFGLSQNLEGLIKELTERSDLWNAHVTDRANMQLPILYRTSLENLYNSLKREIPAFKAVSDIAKSRSPAVYLQQYAYDTLDLALRRMRAKNPKIEKRWSVGRWDKSPAIRMAVQISKWLGYPDASVQTVKASLSTMERQIFDALRRDFLERKANNSATPK